MPEPIVAIADQIRERIAEIDRQLQGVQDMQSEREQLARALGELGERQASARHEPARKTSGRHQRRRARAPQGSNPDRITQALTGSSGMTAVEIGQATDIGSKTLYSTLARMVRSGKVQREDSDDGPRYTAASSTAPRS